MRWQSHTRNRNLLYGYVLSNRTVTENSCRRLLAQSGAVWEFSTDTPGVKFGYAAIPAVGAPSADIPQADIDAIKIDDSGTVWTLSVPTPSVGEHDIVFGLATPSAAASSFSTAGANTTDAPTTTDAPPITGILDTNLQIVGALIITTATDATPAKRRRERPFAVPLTQSVKAKRHPPVGAKFRRAPQADSTPAGQYHLIITGTYPCSDEPGLGLQPQPTLTGTSDPRLVAPCSQNSILPNSAAWSAYAVSGSLAPWTSSLSDCHRRMPICQASFKQQLLLLRSLKLTPDNY